MANSPVLKEYRPMRSLFVRVRTHWGFLFFCLISLLAWIRLLRQVMPGHYRIFVGAGNALWAGVSPHGNDFGTGVGYWFYSPTCGMFFYKFFSWFPEKLGISLYMLLSWAVLVYGISHFFKHVRAFPQGVSLRRQVPQFFWLAIAPQILTAILATKLEILMTGILLISVSWISTRKHLVLASFLLALILNWKFQPLPSIGLVVMAALLLERNWKLPAYLLGGSAFWFLLPVLVKGPSFIEEVYREWNAGLSAFVREAWPNFDNLYSFLQNALGFSLTYENVQALSMTAGVAFAIALGVWMFRRRNEDREVVFPSACLLAVALGSVYTVIFSPLSQNNSTILLAPTWAAFAFLISGETPRWRTVFKAYAVFWFAVMALAYSDGVPISLREDFRHWGIKPLVCFGAGALLFVYCFSTSFTGLGLSKTRRV